jgi:hypothetical protein
MVRKPRNHDPRRTCQVQNPSMEQASHQSRPIQFGIPGFAIN